MLVDTCCGQSFLDTRAFNLHVFECQLDYMVRISGELKMFLLSHHLYVGFNFIMVAGPEVFCVFSHLAPLQDQAYPVLVLIPAVSAFWLLCASMLSCMVTSFSAVELAIRLRAAIRRMPIEFSVAMANYPNVRLSCT